MEQICHADSKILLWISKRQFSVLGAGSVLRHILESVLPKGHLEETNRSIYREACLVQPARCDLLNDRAYFYELTKPGGGHYGVGDCWVSIPDLQLHTANAERERCKHQESLTGTLVKAFSELGRKIENSLYSILPSTPEAVQLSELKGKLENKQI